MRPPTWHAATQGLFAPSANPELSYGKRCGQATHNLLHYPTKRLEVEEGLPLSWQPSK